MNDELYWKLKGNERCTKCGSSVHKKKLTNGVCLACSKPNCFFCNYWKNLKFVEIPGMNLKTWVCPWHMRNDYLEVID